MRVIEESIDRVSEFCYGIAAVALMAIVVLMNLRVLSRNLDLGLAGLQLYAQALAVWMVFIVAGVLGAEDRHIEIDYFTDRLPERFVAYHLIAIRIVSLAMCLFIVAGGVLAIDTYWTGTSPSVNIPMPLYYVPAIIGLSMLGLVYVSDLVDQISALASRKEDT